MAETLELDLPPRFLIGIDLGTTNSAVAYVDTAERSWQVRDFPAPQIVSPGLVESRDTLPSFHYEPAAAERAGRALSLPWQATEADHVVGVYARDQGAAAPGRLISSAKSWLSHSGVDRTAGLLPWHGAADVTRLSPVEVSARYLAHLRGAWDARHPEHPMAAQDVALTAPASFDEVARELTVQAARLAGLGRVVLVEEPQAAFYAWIAAQADAWDRQVMPGQTVLICDVGGGTSDFTLIRVRPAAGGKVLFHRVAVGEHLILGGDNLDLAVAHHVEQKLGRKLDPRAWESLVRASRVAKEALLGENPPEQHVVSLTPGGSKLVGGAQRIALSRQEVADLLLEGFLPRVALSDKPAARRSGFQEFGLPYARDAAITRYLAAFLSAHRSAGIAAGEATGDHDPARPDLILFNGGLFESPLLRQRLLDVLTSWFNPPGQAPAWTPRVLQNDRLDLAVARGAAYYGMVRRGRGVRISGGLAQSYYIGVEADAPTAVCLFPAGVEEGQMVHLSDQTYHLLIRQPVEFPLYASSTRTTDRPGDRVAIDPEQMTALPPIRTLLQSGKKGTAQSVAVHLFARLSEIGTLEIGCAEVNGERSWRLQFDIRSATRSDATAHQGIAEAQGVVDEQVVEAGRRQIAAAFARGSASGPQSLLKTLEQVTAMPRTLWPPTLLRSFWQVLMDLGESRRLSESYELRWLNFAGYCLRPGYGLAADDWRAGQMWKLLPAGLAFPKNENVRAEWWILWRRIAGGLSAGQQRALADPLLADWRAWIRKSGEKVRGKSPTFQFGPHESAEVWRLLGSLELLAPAAKLEIGQMLLDQLAKPHPAHLRDAQLFALGRLGARVPVYGPLNALLEAEVAERWAAQLMAIADGQSNGQGASPVAQSLLFALVQLARRTDDRHRDLRDETRLALAAWLAARGAAEHLVALVRDGGQLQQEEQRLVFGESLPRGLRIE